MNLIKIEKNSDDALKHRLEGVFSYCTCEKIVSSKIVI